MNKAQEAKSREEREVEWEENKDKLEPQCFASDTLVSTIHGLMEIQFIEPGMQVLARNEVTGEIAYKEVINHFVHEDREIWDVIFQSREDYRDGVTVTAEHPFWVVGFGWVEASKLKPKQFLLNKDGRHIEIVVVKKRDYLAEVHNLEVVDFHTYYVSWTGILVHNKGAKRTNPVNYVNRVLKKSKPGESYS